jgi:hypothetical protein
MLKVKTVMAMLFLFAVGIGAVACQKLDTGRFAPGPGTPRAFKILDPIPLDYGELVAVTPHPENAYVVLLWFQKPDKTISVVSVNTSQGGVTPRLTIPRK